MFQVNTVHVSLHRKMAAARVILGFLISSITLTNVVARTRQTLVQFPDDFIFGTATSAYQIEGAWNVDGKGESMWDQLVHTDPDAIADGSNGDIACNSYYNYKRDVEMLKELGVSAYRFSISWPRVLSNGTLESVNPLGIAYYNALLDELIANDIEPFVTMYHWDLPVHFSDLGGWLNEEIVDWFGDYARFLYQTFGNRVKYWMTINEPYIHCIFGYGYAYHAPRHYSPGIGYYECGRNVLLANARAYHIYDEEFRASQGGRVGIVVSMEWPMASYDSENNNEAVLDYHAFHIGQYMDPIFTEQGNYPQRMIDRVAAVSYEQGFNESRLRVFTEEEANYIKGTSDFLALNHYNSVKVFRNESMSAHVVPSIDDDLNLNTYSDPSWPQSEIGWLYEYGPGFYHLLLYIRDTYNNPDIYITENGFSTLPGLIDEPRVSYYRNYLTSVAEATRDGVNVRGYFAWSLMDNFEWSAGYTVKFGIYDVNFDDPERTRTAKMSALVYKEIIRTRTIDFNYDPYADTDAGHIIFSSSLVVAALVAISTLVV